MNSLENRGEAQIRIKTHRKVGPKELYENTKVEETSVQKS